MCEPYIVTEVTNARDNDAMHLFLIDFVAGKLDIHNLLMHIEYGIWCLGSGSFWIGVSPVGIQARFGGLVV